MNIALSPHEWGQRLYCLALVKWCKIPYGRKGVKDIKGKK